MNTKTKNKMDKFNRNKTVKKKSDKRNTDLLLIEKNIYNLTQQEKQQICKSNTLGYTSFESDAIVNKDKMDILNNNLLNFIINNQTNKIASSQRNNFYKYVNELWLKNVNIRDFNNTSNITFESYQKITIQKQLRSIYYDLMTNKSKMHTYKLKTNVRNFMNSAKILNSEESIISYGKYYTNIIDKLSHDTIRNNLWKLVAILNKNKLISSQGLPLTFNLKPNEIDTTQYAIFISPIIFHNNISIYEDSNKNIEFTEKYKKEYIKYALNLIVFFMGPNHGLDPNDAFNCLKQIYKCFDNKPADTNNKEIVYRNESLIKFNFEYNEFFKELGYVDIPESFMTPNTTYLKNVCNLLLSNWNSKEWKCYWYMVIFKSLSKYNSTSRKIQDYFVKLINQGIETSDNPEVISTNLTLVTFNKFFTELYLSKYNNYDAIQLLTNMTNDLKRVFYNNVQISNMFSNKAKQNALLVIDHLRVIIGRPLTIVDDYDISYTNNDIWLNLSNFMDSKHKEELRLNEKHILNIANIDWSKDPYEFIGSQIFNTHISYSQDRNTLYVPLACVQTPYINLNGRGIEYNLANIGFMISYRMYESISYKGSFYDYNGTLINWWDKDDYSRYYKYLNSIINQYKLFAGYDNIKVDTTNVINMDELYCMVKGMEICVEYLKNFHKKQNIPHIIIKSKIINFYVYVTYLFRQKIIKTNINDELNGIKLILYEYAINICLSRSEYFKEIFNVNNKDLMYYKIN